MNTKDKTYIFRIIFLAVVLILIGFLIGVLTGYAKEKIGEDTTADTEFEIKDIPYSSVSFCTIYSNLSMPNYSEEGFYQIRLKEDKRFVLIECKEGELEITKTKIGCVK